MGMTSQPSYRTIKFCALCNYWAGFRETDYWNRVVRYDTETKGQCMGSFGFPKAKQQMRAQDHCSKFLKWTILK